MGKKDKKKGKGQEKAQAKALKKAQKNDGGKDMEELEALISQFKEQDRKENTVAETQMETSPSPRSHATFLAHPEKDVLILFGGEYFNGKTTEMFNQVHLYNLKKESWSHLFVPHGPPPRSGHASVAVPQSGGAIFVHGGEYSSKNGESFYHYKDFWRLTIDGKNSKWEEIKTKGSPSARSGHRAAYFNKQIFIFGGFHERIKDYCYFNDINSFDLVSSLWTTLKPAGTGPSPRSGVQMGSFNNGLLIIGGYSKIKAKKDSDRGQCHSDGFFLTFEEKSKKWKWERAKQGGDTPPPKSGVTLCPINDHRGVSFGGSQDEDDDDELNAEFDDTMNFYDTKTQRWFPAVVKSKDEKDSRLRPGPRMNTHLTMKSGNLFLYGGILEQGDRSYVLNDLWSLDVKKMNQWKRINRTDKMDWEGSDKGSDSEGTEEDEEDSESEESEPEPEVKPKRRKPNHPTPFHAEELAEYMKRTRQYWRNVLEEMDDSDDEEEEPTEEELTIQSEELAKKWFTKCDKARAGETEE